MDHFELVSEYQPTGDQPQAIADLVKGFQEGNQFETLLGVTGSGKTFTITQRILYLIRERRITPEKLLVITFTREAALSMRQRFAQISPQEVHTVNFGTFHSVFYQILLQSGRISSGNILNDRQKRDLILPILKKITDCKKIRRGSNGACRELSCCHRLLQKYRRY